MSMNLNFVLIVILKIANYSQIYFSKTLISCFIVQ